MQGVYTSRVRLYSCWSVVSSTRVCMHTGASCGSLRGCTDGGERLEQQWEWCVCARVPAWPRHGAAGAGKGIMWRCTALLEVSGDGAFTARVRKWRFRMCGGRAGMFGRRVCRRWCNLQDMSNQPYRGECMLLCGAWRERGAPFGSAILAGYAVQNPQRRAQS